MTYLVAAAILLAVFVVVLRAFSHGRRETTRLHTIASEAEQERADRLRQETAVVQAAWQSFGEAPARASLEGAASGRAEGQAAGVVLARSAVLPPDPPTS